MTVLLVEQDAAARLVARERLAAEGFAVVEAESSDKAGVILALRDDILVVVTDVDAPGQLGGAQLAQLLARQAPWISVIVTSRAAAPEHFGCVHLSKQIAPDTLVKMVGAAALAARQLRSRTTGKEP